MLDSRLYLYFVASTLVLFCAIAVLLLIEEDRMPGPAAVERPSRVLRLISDFSYTDYSDNQVAAVLEADDLRVNPRRVGVFNIRKVNELVMSNARFRVYLREDGQAEMDPLSLVKRTLAFQNDADPGDSSDWPKRFGLITRQLIVGLDQEIYDGEDLKMQVRARQVQIDRRSPDPEYLDATLIDPRSQQRIVCRKAIWDRQQKVFRIPGAYVLSNAGVEHRGRDIQVDVDFVVQPL